MALAEVKNKLKEEKRKDPERGGVDPVWERMRREAEEVVRQEPALRGLLEDCLLERDSLEEAVSYRLARKMGDHHAVLAENLRNTFLGAFADDASIGERVRRDIVAIIERDPACDAFLEPFLYFKGFHALCAYRVAHHLWNRDRKAMAKYFQSIISQEFAVDIHPAARIGSGILFDHATSIVIGETAVVEDNVSLLHEVTLGGTGKEHGDRHPKVRSCVLIGAGAKILGNVEIGEGAKVGAGSVVLKDVPAHHTVAGVPAEIIGKTRGTSPALDMDQHIC